MKANLSRCILFALCGVLLLVTGCSKQARAGRHLKRADSYLAADQYEKAEIEYMNVLRLNPTNAPALRGLGNIYFTDELLLRSAAFFNSLKKIEPDDIASRSKLARVYLAGGALKEAREEAGFVLQKSPGDEEALLVLIESSTKSNEVQTLRPRIAALRQQAGDKAVFHIANAYLSLRDRDVKTAESEFKAAVALDPKSASANAALGNFYLSQTNLALAESALKIAADLSPLRSARKLRLVSLHLQNHNLDGANALLSQITSKAPDYTPAWMYTARLALQQTNYDKCASALQRVINRTPDNYEAISLRAEMFLAQGKSDKALEDLDRLVTLYPKSAQFRYQLALAALMAKDTPRAINALSQSVTLDKSFAAPALLLAELQIRKGEPTAAITLLSDLLKRDPRVQRGHMLLATAYQAAGKLDDALDTYNRAAKAFSNAVEIPFMAGVVLRQQGKTADARKIFESILPTHPNDPAANSQLVELDLAANQPADAAQRIQKWIDREPENPEPKFQLAKIRFAQSNFKSAQPLLESVIARNPDAIPAYLLLSRVLYTTKQLDAALDKCQQALARNPRDTSSLLLSAIIFDEKHDWDHSREQYEKLLAISPKNIVALNNLAVIYADRLNQLDKAYPYASQAQTLRPNDPAISDTYGWIVAQRGDYSLALASLREAAQGKPTDPEIIAHLGITQYMLGDENSARLTLERALKLSNSFNGREQAQACLQILAINPTATDAQSIASLEKRVSDRPTDPIALSRLASIYEKSGKLDQVVALYEKALASNPKMAVASARLADLYDRRLNNSAKALDLAKSARKLDNDSPEIALIAGRIAAKSADLKDSQWGLSLLQESARNNPSDASTAFDLGWAYFTQGRVAEAASTLKTASANSTTAVAARRILDFISLLDPARAVAALAQIEQALQADPTFLPALAARATAIQQKGDTANALKQWDEILSRYPAFAPAIRNYTLLAAANSADNAKSLAIANRAREIFPEDAEVSKALGILQYQAADYGKSVRTLAAAAKKRPDDAYIQYYLGMSHYKLKQNKESKAALTNAVRLQANASFIADAQRVLRELQ